MLLKILLTVMVFGVFLAMFLGLLIYLIRKTNSKQDTDALFEMMSTSISVTVITGILSLAVLIVWR